MKLNPLTVKFLRRFRALKRAYISWWLLLGLYALGLGAGLLCNSTPLWMRFEGRSYFPIFKFYPEDIFMDSGRLTRPDYKQVIASERFRQNPNNRVLFAPLPFGPLESVPAESIALPDELTIAFEPQPYIGVLTIDPDWKIVGASGCAWFLEQEDTAVVGKSLTDFMQMPAEFSSACATRWDNHAAPSLNLQPRLLNGRLAMASLATFQPRQTPPATLRVILREQAEFGRQFASLVLPRALEREEFESRIDAASVWQQLAPEDQELLWQRAWARFQAAVPAVDLNVTGRSVHARFIKEEVRYPMRPVAGHPLGLDSAGRDVLARILYGLRISLSFGLLLVVVTMAIGVMVGALQGYYGGWVDLAGQRVIEIWDALPFLYILILMGSVFGRSFGLLLICYGLFNWIGISYYQRGEFLRLRGQAFVEAARCLGLGSGRIMFRHILPNALAPVITFFPFSLVGAIGLLAALDYLGFGMPPPTPSWGELLTQAQEYPWAWWLALYPALALFVVMLLGVFIGEGVRAAFDPRPASKLE